jgi:hypothetical protein
MVPRGLRVVLGLSVVLLGPTLLWSARKASITPLTVNLYDLVVDEHNTTAFYNNGTPFCAGTSPIFTQPASLFGDSVVPGPSAVYGFGSPWIPYPASSTAYVHNTFCGKGSNAPCISAQFNSDNKILTLDTRGTVGPRAVRLDFTHPCSEPGCPQPAGSPTVFGGSLTTPGLVNVSFNVPFTQMAVCTSEACPEAEPAFAKLWFTDLADSSVTWRVDWAYLRVLRISANTWYIVADACDGTQIAGFSKLTGSRTRPKSVFNGYYVIPFFFVAVVQ